MLLRLCELAMLPSDRAAVLRNTESLRRALVVLVVATCAQGAAGQPTAGDDPGALEGWFWAVVCVVVVLLWEGVKLMLRCLTPGSPKRSVTSQGTQTESAGGRARWSQTDSVRPERTTAHRPELNPWTYEDYAEAAHETFVRYGDDAMMAFPAQRRGQASSSAGAWLEPTRVPRPTQDPPEEVPGLPLCVTSAGGCYHRMGCSQLVHCTNVSSYEPCARCITEPTLEWVSSQPAMWFWTSRYHAAGCTLRHNGGTRYVPCRHCLPGVRNRRGNRGG